MALTVYVRSKSRFARRMLWHRLRGQPRVCPYCGTSSSVRFLQRKKIIMDILECAECHLIFRWPQDTEAELDVHYQNQYAVDFPQVRLPDPKTLPALQAENFVSWFGPDLKHKIDIIKMIRPAGRILDYGCSWGYASCLLQQSGYSVVGLEISKPRAAYAREHLGLHAIDSVEAIEALPAGSFDIVYSNHVLEHLPSIGRVLASFARLLAPDGITINALPNFLGNVRRTGMWLYLIGEDHPIAPGVEFFKKALPAAGLSRFAFASSPYDAATIAAMTLRSSQTSQLDGDELLFVAQK
jgi:2-polyprenyl-3-methyl-5-hydroxy-6-metoxy-1,4-benzoquinol methylase